MSDAMDRFNALGREQIREETKKLSPLFLDYLEELAEGSISDDRPGYHAELIAEIRRLRARLGEVKVFALDRYLTAAEIRAAQDGPLGQPVIDLRDRILADVRREVVIEHHEDRDGAGNPMLHLRVSIAVLPPKKTPDGQVK